MKYWDVFLSLQYFLGHQCWAMDHIIKCQPICQVFTTKTNKTTWRITITPLTMHQNILQYKNENLRKDIFFFFWLSASNIKFWFHQEWEFPPFNLPSKLGLVATLRPGCGKRKQPRFEKQLWMCFLTFCSSSCWFCFTYGQKETGWKCKQEKKF